MASVLALIQSICSRSGLPSPTSLVTSPRAFETRYLNTFYAVGEDLISRGTWPQLKKTHSFTTTSADEYAFPSDHYATCIETHWDQTNNWPLKGPVTDGEFARQTYWFGPTYTKTTFRIFGGPLSGDKKPFRMVPVASGLTFSFDYISNEYIFDSTGTTGKTAISAAADICLFPDELVKAGFKYFWLKDNGQDATQAELDYERLISRTMFKLVGPTISSRTPHSEDMVPFNTAEGGWNVS